MLVIDRWYYTEAGTKVKYLGKPETKDLFITEDLILYVDLEDVHPDDCRIRDLKFWEGFIFKNKECYLLCSSGYCATCLLEDKVVVMDPETVVRPSGSKYRPTNINIKTDLP